ncbi:T9SS type A sorting domain-containing protein [Adhaeribacter rhizoryzae]|uniref:T9SS type A sorting domain-containing protein n=1 Tax=Adhaeribacter rhizoryzae TaxID=2607907 RepID=A0A5M6DIM0_9BACT|nr:T9SS type A sorting domain-containing protein [Adhaeribacter rhizoryzae]KAA5547428.1 T9SS type A sorting domain-containing protein [Adhaeribacter rhizoryzae]
MKTGSLLSNLTLYTFLIFIFFAFSSSNAFAQLIGKYEFTGVSTLQTQNDFSAVTAQPYYATFSPFRREVVQWWRGDNVYNSREWAKTPEDERFIEFTVTAKPDYALLLTSLSFDNYRTDAGPTNVRITHNGSGNFNTESFDFSPLESKLSKATWDFTDIIIPEGRSVTFRIYGYGASSYLGAFRVDNLSLFGTPIPRIKLNELHYANTTVTKTGFIELAVPKDFTNLNSVQINLYNSTGEVYSTFSLSNFKTPPMGIVEDDKIYYLDIPAGLVDGQGGIAISSGKHIIQFLSYGGEITGISGPASGLKSQDIGTTENAADGPDNSLYLALKNNANFAPGTWGHSFDNSNTKGFPNIDNSVLPVELIFFKALVSAKEIILSWATAMEKNNEQFVLERSQEGISDFNQIGVVKGNGDSNSEKQYRFADKKPLPGTSYYRLKQVDLDGTITYSPVIAVEVKLSQPLINLYPNPATDILNVDLGNSQAYKEINVRIVNALGKVIYQQSATNPNTHAMAVPVAALPAGTYYLVVIKDNTQESKTFVKR